MPARIIIWLRPKRRILIADSTLAILDPDVELGVTSAYEFTTKLMSTLLLYRYDAQTVTIMHVPVPKSCGSTNTWE